MLFGCPRSFVELGEERLLDALGHFYDERFWVWMPRVVFVTAGGFLLDTQGSFLGQGGRIGGRGGIDGHRACSVNPAIFCMSMSTSI